MKKYLLIFYDYSGKASAIIEIEAKSMAIAEKIAVEKYGYVAESWGSIDSSVIIYEAGQHKYINRREMISIYEKESKKREALMTEKYERREYKRLKKKFYKGS